MVLLHHHQRKIGCGGAQSLASGALSCQPIKTKRVLIESWEESFHEYLSFGDEYGVVVWGLVFWSSILMRSLDLPVHVLLGIFYIYNMCIGLPKDGMV